MCYTMTFATYQDDEERGMVEAGGDNLKIMTGQRTVHKPGDPVDLDRKSDHGPSWTKNP